MCCAVCGPEPGRIGEVTPLGPCPAQHRGGPLRPSELAQASVMAALCAVTAIISVVVPFAAGLALLGTVPTGLLAYRYRLRVLAAATVAAGMIAFLIAGLGGFMGVVHSAYIGGLTGIVKRRGRGTPTVVVSSLIGGFVFGAAMVGMLAAMVRLRHLIFKVMTANVDGIAATLARMHMQGAAADVKRYFAEGLQYWPWVLLGYFNIGIMIVSLIGWWALSRLLERMRGIPDVHKLDPPPGDDVDALIGPVPVRLDKVRFRYPRAGQDALREVSLDVRAGEHLAIIGANGSGKTTLMLILAVVGELGRSAAGYALWCNGIEDFAELRRRHLVPQPPYGHGAAAAAVGAQAMIDVSDGLLADLRHIAEASGVRIDLSAAALAADRDALTAAATALGTDPWPWVLSGGEDHALVACFVGPVPAGWRTIGRVLDGPARVLVDGEEWTGYAGWQSFGEPDNQGSLG